MADKRSDIYRHFKLPEQSALEPDRFFADFRKMQLRMIADFEAVFLRRRKPPGTAAAPVPADPRKPNTLSGGAAAALDFD